MRKSIVTALFFSAIGFSATTLQAQTTEDSAAIVAEFEQKDSYIIDEESENKPEESYEDFLYKPAESTIVMPMNITVSRLEKELNKSLNGTIYEDNKIEDDSLKLKIVKYGNITLNFDGTLLTAEIPLKIFATYRLGLGITYTDRDLQGALKIKLQSSLYMTKAWGVNSKTTILGYTWIERPTLKVANFNVPITTIVESQLNKQKGRIAQMVDKAAKDQLPIKSYAQEFWTKVQDPFPINVDSMTAWVRYEPTAISMAPIIGKNGVITSALGMKCKLEMAVNTKPNVTKNTTLPQLQLTTNMKNGFTLNILADIPYSTLASIAQEKFKDMTFGEGKHSIKVEGVQLYGAGSELGIALNTSGFVNGNIYLTGTPYFDDSKKIIRIKDVTYKLKTKNILTKSINLILKPILKKKIEKEVEVDLRDQLQLAQQMSESSLLNSTWATDVTTTGKITDINGTDLFITSAGIQANAIVTGTVNLTVK